MAQSVKLSDDVMSYVRKESARQSRSVAGQITHWIRIGRSIENSSSFNYERIAQALDGERSPDDLTAEEQEVWFEQFAEEMTKPSAEEQAFFSERRKFGRGVGLSASGELVYAEPKTR